MSTRYQEATDTAPYTVFCAYPRKLADKRKVFKFATSLPGFVKMYAHTPDQSPDMWKTDGYGLMFVFANQVYAGSAALDLESTSNPHSDLVLGLPSTFGPCRPAVDAYTDADYALRLEAAQVAFKHTPSATHFVRLHKAMLDYQANHPINAEYTQR